MNWTSLVGALALAAPLAALGIGMAASDAAAQKPCERATKGAAENTEYTQQHVIDAADMPGHQVRIYELHTTYPDAEPNCEGLKQVESWTWGYSDYIQGSGRAWGYGVSIFDNGDKWFTVYSGTSQVLPNPEGQRKRLFTGTASVTGGTGVYKGVRGNVRSHTYFDPETGYNESEDTVAYWIEK